MDRTFGKLKEDLFGLLKRGGDTLAEIMERLIEIEDTGNLALLRSIIPDLGSLKKENGAILKDTKMLYQKGITDGMTDLHTRTYINELIPRGFEHPVAYLMGDIDKFKDYNSAYGHPQGDMAIKHIAGVFQNTIIESALKEETPFIFRYGGEEFGAFIENFQGDDGELNKRANLVCNNVEKLIIPREYDSIFKNENDENYKHRTLTITGSISRKDESAKRLMGRVNGILNKLKSSNLRGQAKVT